MSYTYYLKKISPSGTSFQEIHLGDVMSSGAEGTVYKIQGKDSWNEQFGSQKTVVTKRVCAKIYSVTHLAKHGKQIEAKLKFMGQHRPQFLHDGPNNMIQICYPFGLLYDSPNGAFVGFLMYLGLDGSASMSIIAKDTSPSYYQRLYQMGKMKETEWQIFQKFKFAPNYQPSRERYIIVHNIASMIHYLHDTRKYVIVDMKPENFLITIRGGISLVDVDSVQVSYGYEKYPSLMATPDYVPPECYNNKGVCEGMKDVSFDLFSMAVIFYKILTGTHPYCYSVKKGGVHIGTSVPEHIQRGGFACGNGRSQFMLTEQHKRFDNLPKTIQDLFRRAFEGKPERRPTALEWKHTMGNLLNQKINLSNTTKIVRQNVPNIHSVTGNTNSPSTGIPVPNLSPLISSRVTPFIHGLCHSLQRSGRLICQQLLRWLSWGKQALTKWLYARKISEIRKYIIAIIAIPLCLYLGAVILDRTSSKETSVAMLPAMISFPNDISGNYMVRMKNGRNDIYASAKVYRDASGYVLNVFSSNITKKHKILYDPSTGVIDSDELGRGKARIKEYTNEIEITFEGWELLK